MIRIDIMPHSSLASRYPFWFLLASLMALTFLVVVTTYASSNYRQVPGLISSPVPPMLDSDSFEYPDVLPQVAWILSFGGSGTSYTILNTEQRTGTTTASNYGSDYIPCLPVLPDSPHGPFLRSPSKNLPQHYILTKTHCGGFCMDCPPSSYVIPNATVFATACATGKQRFVNGTIIETQYSSKLPARAVHLIRHPFDNIVGRYHLAAKHQRIQHQHLNFTNDRSGLVEWCNYLDTSYTPKEQDTIWFTESRAYNADFVNNYSSVPCHAEWFRYIQFHNFANEILQNMPVHYLYYDNYTTDWDTTVHELLDFLQLSVVNATPCEWKKDDTSASSTNPIYMDHWPFEWQHDAAHLMRDLATPTTWKLIQHYLEPYL